jgi:hypothetical protein
MGAAPRGQFWNYTLQIKWDRPEKSRMQTTPSHTDIFVFNPVKE